MKEECVGHVQKKIGGRSLREYKRINRGKKLADGKSVGVIGRITDKVIDNIQTYYGLTIRRNKGILQGMKNVIIAILIHIVKDETASLEEQPAFCPKDETTWCTYWKDQTDKISFYNESKRLPYVLKEELESIFIRLSQDDLLKGAFWDSHKIKMSHFTVFFGGQCAKDVFLWEKKT